MFLDEQDLREGLRFIVGKWQVDYIVNAFSNDLAHIPATEFKSDDGRDFSAIRYSFFEDHSVEMEDVSTGKKVSGTWEQTDWGEYHYTFNDFIDLPEGAFKENVEKLTVQDGYIVFSLGFLAIAMKKIEEGTVTEPEKEPDIGDLEPSAEDLKMTGIVGSYRVEKAMSMVGDKFDLFTRDEVFAELNAKKAAGEIDDEEIADALSGFNTVVEFTPEHEIITWMKLPDGVDDAMIKEAVEAGEILAAKDGMMAVEAKEWKALGGRYYYDTGEHREVFGEVKSSWDELTVDESGCVPFASGMWLLKKI